MTQEERWLAWTERVLQGPCSLPLPSTLFTRPVLESIWRGAVREIAARVLTNAAREGAIDGWVAGNVLLVQGLAPPDGSTVIGLGLYESRPFDLHRIAPQILDDPQGSGALLDTGLGLEGEPAWMLDPLFDAAACSAEERRRVRAELIDSIHNLAGARLADRLRQALAVALSPEDPRRADPRLGDPEHFVTDGHPWHPMCRTRLGLSRADVMRHAPELLAGTTVRCVDVDATLVQTAGDWSERAPSVFGAAEAGRVRLPIHPVQLRRLPRLFPEAWARGAMRPTTVAIPARSLLSLRTVALPEHPYHLKLGLGVHTTSARRVVSPMSVANGPVVSDLLRRLQSEAPALRSLEIMSEPAAAGLRSEKVGPAAAELGAILRLAPADPQRTWVCAAIGERWPGSDARVLERACTGYPGDGPTRLQALLDDWMQALIPPCLELLSRYGVVLEVHLQNTLVHVVDGRLRGFAIRDLGGIRLHGPRLHRAGHDLDLAPGSFIMTDDLEEVRGKLEHTLFHAHLAELFAVADGLGVPQVGSWGRARMLIDDCYRRLAAEPALTPAQRQDAEADHRHLLKPRVRAKALFRMRMHDRVSDYEYTEVDNILAQFDPET
ncbi:MAG: hypothetical protein KC457_05925 [Myxococcales bacterium]|nr:hypothetical protein [Myxococcales bacterium]